jgi:uncharacterized protein YodC (DUF2158 family)
MNPGDVVRLKSGGPIMTIRSTSNQTGNTVAYCDWFVNDEHKSQPFRAEQLVKIDPNSAEIL